MYVHYCELEVLSSADVWFLRGGTLGGLFVFGDAICNINQLLKQLCQILVFLARN